MNLDKILDDPIQLLATTGLYRSELDELFKSFEPRWRQAFKHFDTHGKRRKLPLTSKQIAKDTKGIHGPKMKLFLILNHFKVNSIPHNEAVMYDMDQPRVSRWIKLLMPVLQQATVDLHLHPARTSDEMIRLFRNRQHPDRV